MKRLLITGARGFIGRSCVMPALEAGYEVHAIYRAGEVPSHYAAGEVHWHKADLLVQGAGRQLIEAVRPTHVLHLAWDVTHGSYWTSPSNLRWLAAGTELLSAFGEEGGERFVSAGSCAEYQWTGKTLVEETSPDLPATFYGRIKLVHHEVLRASAARFGFSATTGRIFFGYGCFENPLRLVPYACQQLIAGKKAIFGNGGIVRDFLSVEDIGRGFVSILENDVGSICNIASENPVPLAAVVDIIGEISGRADLIHFSGTSEPGASQDVIVGSNSRLKDSGWKPQVRLHDGLEQAYRWWNERM